MDPRRQAPTPPTWTPPPLEALAVAGDLSSWDCPNMDQVLWVGKGAVGRVGLWEGDASQALFADAPEAVPAAPPTCPYHPTFLSRTAPTPPRYLVGSMTYGSQGGMGTGVRHASAASFTKVPGVHCLYRRRHGHLWRVLPWYTLEYPIPF